MENDTNNSITASHGTYMSLTSIELKMLSIFRIAKGALNPTGLMSPITVTHTVGHIQNNKITVHMLKGSAHKFLFQK